MVGVGAKTGWTFVRVFVKVSEMVCVAGVVVAVFVDVSVVVDVTQIVLVVTVIVGTISTAFAPRTVLHVC